MFLKVGGPGSRKSTGIHRGVTFADSQRAEILVMKFAEMPIVLLALTVFIWGLPLMLDGIGV
jgi:hypothetical protein